jgi:hypothetical protein
MDQPYEFVQSPMFLGLITMPEFADPLLASRLASFAHADASPTSEHRVWLRGACADLIRKTPGSYVRLIGHASMIGNAGYNRTLSQRRIDEVEKILKSALGEKYKEIYKEQARGTRDSGTDAKNDDPRFRCVEVMVMGTDAPRPKADPNQQPTESEVLFSKSTFTEVFKYKDFEPPEPGSKFNKLSRVIFNAVVDAIVLQRHLKRRPYERYQPDFGKITMTMRRWQDSRLVMVAIEIRTRFETKMEFLKYSYRMFNEYTYIYAPGQRSHKVIVRRTYEGGETMPSFEVDNPVDYEDP